MVILMFKAIFKCFFFICEVRVYKGKPLQGTCIKDPWTKPKGGKIEGGRWGWVGWGQVVTGKWRQLYLNNNKK